MSQQTGCASTANACSDGSFEFYAGEDLTLPIHLTQKDANGVPKSFDLTTYTPTGSPVGSIMLVIPGVDDPQEATIVGNPTDGNIVLDFNHDLTNVATPGEILGILTESITGKVRKFKSIQSIKKMG